MSAAKKGPLSGIRVIEMKGIGPGPYAGMLLADLGAEVIVVEKSPVPSGLGAPSQKDIHSRGKRSVVIDLKSDAGLESLLTLVKSADVIFEANRPGVAERLGFGPDACLAKNPRIIYGRMTGWGQTGPLAGAAGHDINYISLVGALAAIGTAEKPVVPLNLIGDYAGGSLFLVVGILAALIEVRNSGKGQVIDAAITDGTASLMSIFHTLDSLQAWRPVRARNLLDGGAPFYDVYETADEKFISIGPLEPQFYQQLLALMKLSGEAFARQHDATRWAEQKRELAAAFRQQSRDYWCGLLEGTDVCFAPVLDYREAPLHPHNKARQTYIRVNDVVQPAPAPRFSRTPPDEPSAPVSPGADTAGILGPVRK